MEFRELSIQGISHSSTQSGAYALILEDLSSNIKLPVVIGSSEAQSISIGIEKDLKPKRPLTHDLFHSFITHTGYTVTSVVIHQIKDGVFFSNIYFQHTETEEQMILDARTSDAIGLAVRFGVPIYTTVEVLNEAGIMMEIITGSSSDEMEVDLTAEEEVSGDQLEKLSITDLNHMLENAVAEEDFDLALKIQEELKRRKNKID